MAEKDALWHLSNLFPLFAGLGPDDCAELERLVRHIALQPGAELRLSGDDGEHVYFLKEGRMRLGLLGPTGKEVTLDYLRAGALFGALDQRPGQICAGFATAVEAVMVCRIPRDAYVDFVSARPEKAFEVNLMLEARIVKLQRRLEALLFLDLRTRILHTLAELAEGYGERTGEGVRLDLRLTHEDIARLNGATREATSVAIAQLRADGLLSFDKKRPVLCWAVGRAARCVSA